MRFIEISLACDPVYHRSILKSNDLRIAETIGKSPMIVPTRGRNVREVFGIGENRDPDPESPTFHPTFILRGRLARQTTSKCGSRKRPRAFTHCERKNRN